MKSSKTIVKTVIMTLLLCIVLASCAGLYTEEPFKDIETNAVLKDSIALAQYYQSPTTGKISYGFPTSYKPVACMIDNSGAARPQWGLQYADIVYEANVEGGYTRFMLLFNDYIPDFVGPVRSARVYFIRMQREWDALYMHCGGPNWGDDTINIVGSEAAHIDHRFNAIAGYSTRWFCWRETSDKITSPYAPHNLFVNPQAAYNSVEEDCEARTPLKFAQTNSYDALDTTIAEMRINFYYGSYTRIVYQPETDKMIRYSGTRLDYDGYTKEPVQIQNLIVMHCNYSMHADNVHRIVDLVGTGRADYVIGGKHIQGTWSRTTYDDDTVYLDGDGNEIALTAGNTWIIICPAQLGISITYAKDVA